ncbi:MAG: amidohydrolase family protein [Longimicrobiales bacterium]
MSASTRWLAALAMAAFSAPACLVAQERITAFVDVSVLPMDRERVLEHQTVIVRGENIQALGPVASTRVPEGATRIDGRGKFLMPGLAEMHAHIPGAQAPEQVIADIMYLYIANGITTIRGMLGAPNQFQWRDRAVKNEIVAPYMVLAGPSLNQNSATSVQAAMTVVQQNAQAGYDLQKIHPGFGRAIYDSAAAAAKRANFKMAGHVPVEVGLRRALEVKQDIDHLDGYLEAAVPEAVFAKIVHPTEVITWSEILRSIDHTKIPALVRATVSAGIYNSPTMYLWENIWGTINVDSMARLPEMKYVPRQWVQNWINQKNGRTPFDTQNNITPEDRKKLLEFRRALLDALADGGALLLMGTDSPQMFNVPGFALHHELQLMRKSGLTPFQVLQSGTVNVGRYTREVLGKPGNFGTVASGQRADLVLLDANPFADLTNVTKRSGVMARGRWFSAAELSAGLDAMATRHAQTTN